MLKSPHFVLSFQPRFFEGADKDEDDENFTFSGMMDSKWAHTASDEYTVNEWGDTVRQLKSDEQLGTQEGDP